VKENNKIGKNIW